MDIQAVVNTPFVRVRVSCEIPSIVTLVMVLILIICSVIIGIWLSALIS